MSMTHNYKFSIFSSMVPVSMSEDTVLLSQS